MKKIIFGFCGIILLSNCVQSSVMVGPAITLASTGNIYQAGVSLGANKAIENETGMSTKDIIKKNLDNKKKKNEELNNSIAILLELNIEKTKQKLIKKNY